MSHHKDSLQAMLDSGRIIRLAKTFPVDPVGKPRMTQRDKWKVRPCVARFFAFRDAIRLTGKKFRFPDAGATVVFHIPMPKSWSKKKRAAMDGQPHQQRPDKDNLEKALLDSLFSEDCTVYDTRTIKLWGTEGKIEVYLPVSAAIRKNGQRVEVKDSEFGKMAAQDRR